MRCLTLSIFLLLPFAFFAQTSFVKKFNYGYTESIRDLKQTTDGGYVMVGNQGINIGLLNIVMIKTDSLGEEQWHRIFDFNADQEAHSVELLSDGGYVIGGYINTIPRDAYVIRTDALGDTLWTKTYTAETSDKIFDALVIENDNVVVVGESYNPNTFLNQVFIMQIDADGNPVWKEYIDVGTGGGAKHIEAISTGGYIITGSVNMENLSTQALLMKVDYNGNTLWTKHYGWDQADFGTAVIEIEDGFIVAGLSAELPDITYDKYLIRVNTVGDTLWTKVISDGIREESIKGMIPADEDHFIIMGTDYNRPSGLPTIAIEVLKMSIDGEVIWEEEYRTQDIDLGHSIGYQITNTSDGGYAIGGFSSEDCFACALLIKASGNGPDSTPIIETDNPDIALKVYPNPSLGIFNVEVSPKMQSLEKKYTLYDNFGRIILTGMPNQDNISPDIHAYPAGIYILQFTADNLFSTIKLIKE